MSYFIKCEKNGENIKTPFSKTDMFLFVLETSGTLIDGCCWDMFWGKRCTDPLKWTWTACSQTLGDSHLAYRRRTIHKRHSFPVYSDYGNCDGVCPVFFFNMQIQSSFWYLELVFLVILEIFFRNIFGFSPGKKFQ